MSRRTSARLWPASDWKMALCSLSTGRMATPRSAARAHEQLAGQHQRLLVGEPDRLAGLDGGGGGAQPGPAGDGGQHEVDVGVARPPPPRPPRRASTSGAPGRAARAGPRGGRRVGHRDQPRAEGAGPARPAARRCARRPAPPPRSGPGSAPPRRAPARRWSRWSRGWRGASSVEPQARQAYHPGGHEEQRVDPVEQPAVAGDEPSRSPSPRRPASAATRRGRRAGRAPPRRRPAGTAAGIDSVRGRKQRLHRECAEHAARRAPPANPSQVFLGVMRGASGCACPKKRPGEVGEGVVGPGHHEGQDHPLPSPCLAAAPPPRRAGARSRARPAPPAPPTAGPARAPRAAAGGGEQRDRRPGRRPAGPVRAGACRRRSRARRRAGRPPRRSRRASSVGGRRPNIQTSSPAESAAAERDQHGEGPAAQPGEPDGEGEAATSAGTTRTPRLRFCSRIAAAIRRLRDLGAR